MTWRSHRRPVWQPSELSRFKNFLRDLVKKVAFRDAVLAVVLVPLLLYIGREVFHDALIIDPFTVPKRFEETGLTPEVMANRIGDAMRQIEIATETHLKKDVVASLRDYSAVPDVEIPGTKLGLQTIVEMTRTVLRIYPKHISGDIVVPGDAKSNAIVTFYLTQGSERSPATVFSDVPAADVGLLAARTAEEILRKINPYMLAVHRWKGGDSADAGELARQIVKDRSQDPDHISAAFDLWGTLLRDQGQYEEASDKFQSAIAQNPKYATTYTNWGLLLLAQGKVSEAIDKWKKAIEVDPKNTDAYFSWGIALYEQNNYSDAAAKFQKVTEIDRGNSKAYYLWGNVLSDLGKFDKAAEEYQRAVEIDPNYFDAYYNWGVMLGAQKQYAQAALKYQKAVAIDPKDPDTYDVWGNVLSDLGKYDEAAAKYRKAVEIDPENFAARYDWGDMLSIQKRYDDAASKYQEAIKIDPKNPDSYDALGNVLRAQGNLSEAARDFAKAQKIRSSQ